FRAGDRARGRTAGADHGDARLAAGRGRADGRILPGQGRKADAGPGALFLPSRLGGGYGAAPAQGAVDAGSDDRGWAEGDGRGLSGEGMVIVCAPIWVESGMAAYGKV